MNAIQHAKEDIEKDKAVLYQMDEKELLARIMIALNGYGSRFERIEVHLTDDQIAEKIARLFQNVTERINAITSTLIEQIEAMNESIESSINDSDLRQRMDSISSELGSLSSDIDAIKSSVFDINVFDAESIGYRYKRIDAVREYCNDDFEMYRAEISDHLPICLEITMNE